MEIEEKIELAARWIAESERLVIFTGGEFLLVADYPIIEAQMEYGLDETKGYLPPNLHNGIKLVLIKVTMR